jgi:multidrug/hemolysin transport system ATP-binding protein
MEEAAEADFVIIIEGGKKVAEGTPIQLKNKYSCDYITVYGECEDKLKELNLKYEKVVSGYRIEIENTLKATELIVKHPEIFTDYEVVKGKMDSVFLAVTGKNLTGDK